MDEYHIKALGVLAASQHGLFTLGQAAALGLPPRAVVVATQRGWLRRVRRGIYRVTGAPVSRWEPLMAAALSCGPEGVISHHSAAMIHGFDGVVAGRPDLTIPNDGRRRLAGVVIHRTRTLDPDDVEIRSGMRITAPVRTVIDIAGGTGDYLLGRILDDGVTRHLWTAAGIEARLDRLGGSGRSGTRRIRRLLDDRGGEGHTDTWLEQRVLRVLKGRVPDPVLHHQVVLDDRVIDMDLAWPEHRIDGEIDGYRAHAQRSDFDRDRLRANALIANGWRLVHWTSTMDDRTIVAQVAPYFGTG